MMLPTPMSTDETTSGSKTANHCEAALPPSNPFSTKFIRPSAMPFVFQSPAANVETVIERLRTNAWRGQITGPHGSGKTTLLHALRVPIERCGRCIEWFTLSTTERRLPIGRETCATWNDQTQLIVDGFEQLGRLARRWLMRQVRTAGAGILVTAHSPIGLPQIYRTGPTLELARRLAVQLSPDANQLIDDRRLAKLFQKHHGDVREVLFEYYDAWEHARRTGR